jgi:hypothetical protein
VAACDGQLPFDLAFSADDVFILAWMVAKGENEGGQFVWETMTWKPRR